MTILVNFLFLVSAAFVVVSQKANEQISVNPERQMLVDSYGRERFFHGTNVVVKHFPFHPELNGYGEDTFSEVDMKILQELGLNVIRLGIFHSSLLASSSLCCWLAAACVTSILCQIVLNINNKVIDYLFYFLKELIHSSTSIEIVVMKIMM